MSFLFFLRGFLGALVAFAVVSYLITHSLWTTLIQTAICAVLIQIGYFAAVLFLVWKSRSKPAHRDIPADEGGAAPTQQAKPKALPLRSVRR